MWCSLHGPAIFCIVDCNIQKSARPLRFEFRSFLRGTGGPRGQTLCLGSLRYILRTTNHWKVKQFLPLLSNDWSWVVFFGKVRGFKVRFVLFIVQKIEVRNFQVHSNFQVSNLYTIFQFFFYLLYIVNEVRIA